MLCSDELVTLFKGKRSKRNYRKTVKTQNEEQRGKSKSELVTNELASERVTLYG